MPQDYQNENASLAGFGFDALGWATYRNPFFTSRMGTSGWDPTGSKWKSRLNSIFAPGTNKKYKQFDTINRYSKALAENAKAEEVLGKRTTRARKGIREATRRNEYATRRAKGVQTLIGDKLESDMGDFYRERLSRGRVRNEGAPRGKKHWKKVKRTYREHQEHYAEMYEFVEDFKARNSAKAFGFQEDDIRAYQDELRKVKAARKAGKKKVSKARRPAAKAARKLGFNNIDEARAVAGAPARPGGVMNAVARVAGERGLNAREAYLARQSREKLGGLKWMGELFGKGKGAAARHAAGMYGLGRVLTGANVAMLAYDFTKLALKPFELLAEVGVNARSAPVVQTGAGIRAPSMAATIRQQAIAQIQSSEFAPRNLIGQEAAFLHV